MKSVEQSDIGVIDIQVYAKLRYSNSYGRKSAHCAEQALPGIAARSTTQLCVALKLYVTAQP